MSLRTTEDGGLGPRFFLRGGGVRANLWLWRDAMTRAKICLTTSYQKARAWTR
jgi:hypothetical protein